MERHLFNVSMEIIAPNEDYVHDMLDGMPHSNKLYNVEIEDDDAPRFIERIRYVEDYEGHGEAYVFEGKWTNDNEWSLDTAFYLKDDMISYQALTKVRELMRNGTEFSFS